MKDPRPHEKLEVWKRGIDLCVDIYRVTDHFPSTEKFGLSAQMRRAAVSVPSNIAEGAGSGSIPLYIRSLNISRGSLAELDTQLEISSRLSFISKKDYRSISEKSAVAGKMLTNLIKALRKNL